MSNNIEVSNGINNLLLIQKCFGYSTITADNFYRALSEQNLLNEPMDTALSRIKFDPKQVDALKTCDKGFIEKIIKDCKENDIKILPIYSSDYPDILRNIYQPPLLLFVKLHTHHKQSGLVLKQTFLY